MGSIFPLIKRLTIRCYSLIGLILSISGHMEVITQENGDLSFENFVSLASQHGVKSGAYYFGTPTKSENRKDDAEAQAQQFIKKLKSGYGDSYGQLIPMLDVEEYTDRTTGTAGHPMASNMTGEELVEWILAFQDYFYRNTKRTLAPYSSPAFF